MVFIISLKTFEFLEFEFRSDGRLRYANDSKYKSDVIIRKEVYVNPCIL